MAVQQLARMLAATADCVIFLYLGLAAWGPQHWDSWFIGWGLAILLLVRFLGVFLLSGLANLWGAGLDWRCQVTLGYCGLRGAVGFSLVSSLPGGEVAAAPLLTTATLAVVASTVFIQGGSVRWLVRWLHIPAAQPDPSPLSAELHGKMMDILMSGLEVIAGQRGHFYALQCFSEWDRRHLKPRLCAPDYQRRLAAVCGEVSRADHLTRLYCPALIVQTAAADQEQGGADNPGYQDTETRPSRAKPSLHSLATSLRWLAAVAGPGQAGPAQLLDRNWVDGADNTAETVFAAKREAARRLRERLGEEEGGEKRGRVGSMVDSLERRAAQSKQRQPGQQQQQQIETTKM